MTPLGRPQAFNDTVETHFDELDFLWEFREANVFTPDWTLQQLAEHEERVEANLDGLRLAELHGIDLARDRIAGGTASAAAAATFVLWEGGEQDFLELILGQIAGGEIPIVDGVRSALRHCGMERIEQRLVELASGGAPVPAAAAADVLAFHRRPAVALDQILRSASSWARAMALGAAGRLRQLSESDLAGAIEDSERTVRLAAFVAGARAAVPGLAAGCRAVATRGTDPDPDALAFLGALGDPRDLPLLQEAASRPILAEAAIAGVGALGRVEGIPWLIELMTDKRLGVFATAAYRRITGATDVEGERPFPPPPVPEGEDEDEALPPDPAKAAADWERRTKVMTADRGWQAGLPVDETMRAADFDRLSLASRRDLYLRLCSRGLANVPDLELEALAGRQRRV